MGIEGRRGRGAGIGTRLSGAIAAWTAPTGPLWTRPRGAAALVAVVVAAAFARSLGNAFTYDEPLVIVQAQSFLKAMDVGVLFTRDYFAASLEGTWRPFCTLTYMIDALAFGPAAFKAQSATVL